VTDRRIGWWPHEIIWVEAAITLKGEMKFAAFRDISEMTGRSYAAVLSKAYEIINDKTAASIAKQIATKKAKLLAVQESKAASKVPSEPSFIRPLSKAELMTGRAM